MNPQIRNLRIMQSVFVLYAIGLFLFLDRLHPSTVQNTSSQFIWAITAIAIIDLAIGFFIRAAFVGKSHSTDIPYERRVKIWFSGNLVGFAFSLSTCLFGLVIHMLGGSKRIVQILFGLGIVMLLAQNPGEPPEKQPRSIA